MAMDLCIDERDDERESEAVSSDSVEARLHFFALTLDWTSLSLSLSLFIFLVDAKVHSHLICHVSLCDGPRPVLLSFGLVAPTCFIYFWPRLVWFCFGPDLFYFYLAPTCFIVFRPRLVLFAFGLAQIWFIGVSSNCFIVMWPRLFCLFLLKIRLWNYKLGWALSSWVW